MFFSLKKEERDITLCRVLNLRSTTVAGIPCTWSYEMQSIFHNNFGGEIEAEALSKNVLQKVITLHPIKRPRQMYLMHRVFLRLKSAELRHQLIELERDARQMLYYQVSSITW